MSKKRRRPAANTQIRPVQNDRKAEATMRALDGFINSLAYLGEASELERRDDYKRHVITRDYELLTVLYRENWITKRIIDLPCEDMTRAWYSISSEIEQDKLDEIAKLEAKHNVKQEVTNMLRWARLYGGAAAVMVIKGQEDMLDQPLDFDTLVPGCFHGLIVVDRTNGLYPSLEIEEDMDDPDYGYPKYYNVITEPNGGETLKVHHSRMLMARGRMLPIQEEINEDYWGASEIEHIYEELQKRNATSANIAQLVFQANVSAMKIGNFGEAMATGTDQMKQKIMQAIFDMNRIKNSSGLLVMGSDDNYEQHPYSFAGIAEVYESFMLDMAGAAEIPATKLYGRSPQGMNSTGESDMNNYYEKLAQLQENQLRPAIEKLLPVMAMSLWGEIPEDMEIVFKPLATTTPAERAEIMSKQAETVVQAFSAGIISQRMALLELQEQGKSIGAWTNITDEDIERADDEFDQGEGMEDPMGMMGPGGPEMGGMPPEGPEGPGGPPMPEQAPEQPQEGEIQPETDERAAKIHELRERIQKLREKSEEETEDGGPGSGPRPGYHKNGSSLLQRAKFIANPTAGMPEVKQPQRTKASVAKANKERNEWSNLSLHQKIEGNAQQEKHMREVKAQAAKLAAKGDIEGARKIVQQNRHYWSNDPASAEKVQSETLKRQKAVKSGFIGDALRAVVSFFRGDAWEESKHPRGKGGKFAPKGSGSASGSGESATVKSAPVDFTEASKQKQPETPKMAEGPIDNSPHTGYNGGGTSKPSLVKTAAKKFRETFHAAKAAVAKERPEAAWRVDSTYTDGDYEDMDCYTTPGGSAVAVHNGDIVSVCKHPGDKAVRGSDLLAHARAQGGNKLDAFGGLYGFYIRNGFEPVSWCPFADVKGIRPDDWVRGRDHKEPVIFFKYTGRPYDEISKQYGERKSQFVRRVKKSDDYFAAQKKRDDSMNGG